MKHGIQSALVASFLTIPIAGSEPLPPPQAVDGVYLQLLFEDSEAGWYRHHWEIWVAADRLRLSGFTEHMDDEQTQSLFLVPDPEPTFIFVHDGNRTAMTCTVSKAVALQKDTMEMGDWPIVASPEGPLIVLPTGTGKMIDPWDAYELQLRKPGPEKERIRVSERQVDIVTRNLDVASLWFSAQMPEGREGVAELVHGALRPYLDAGGSGLWFHSLYLHTLVGLRARPMDGLPASLPVQIIVSDPSGPQAISTLRAIRVGAIDPSIFEPPRDYEQSAYPGC